jgi:IclR family transcriptional regulator, pca regulon regulatory protein
VAPDVLQTGKANPINGKGDDQLRTVARSADVLELVITSGSTTLKDVQRELGLGHTVAHRILQTWTSLHYLNFDAQRKVYRAGLKLLWTGMRVRAALDNPDLDARLRQVLTTLGFTANVGVLDGRDVIHVARNEGRYGPFGMEVGSALPAHATSLGRVLLAYEPEPSILRRYADADLTAFTANTITTLPMLLEDLREIRRQTYAFSLGMMDVASGTVAVPLRDADGRVVASMNVVGPLSDFGADAIRDRILPAMLEIATPPVSLPPLIAGRHSYRHHS